MMKRERHQPGTGKGECHATKGWWCREQATNTIDAKSDCHIRTYGKSDQTTHKRNDFHVYGKSYFSLYTFFDDDQLFFKIHLINF